MHADTDTQIRWLRGFGPRAILATAEMDAHGRPPKYTSEFKPVPYKIDMEAKARVWQHSLPRPPCAPIIWGKLLHEKASVRDVDCTGGH